MKRRNNKKNENAIAELAMSSKKASEALAETSVRMGDFASGITSIASIPDLKINKEQIEKAEEKKLEEWIWVEGYKGTDNDMKCNDYQYMLGVRHDMPEGAKIEECRSGFHFCRDLKDVFLYYEICKGHRFFKVRALVRKVDFEHYGKHEISYYPNWSLGGPRRKTKLVAKSIEFMHELTVDEIMDSFSTIRKDLDILNWTEEDKKIALERGVDEVLKIRKKRDLVYLGYSDELSEYIVAKLNKFDLAKVLASQTDISMDTRVSILFCGKAESHEFLWFDGKKFNMPTTIGTMGFGMSKS